jgi:hypothetical protein
MSRESGNDKDSEACSFGCGRLRSADAIPPAGAAVGGPSITSFPSPYLGLAIHPPLPHSAGTTTRSEALPRDPIRYGEHPAAMAATNHFDRSA